ncbi:MAG: hypothetical protein KatS3mg060_2212 [Dehalococcoidia bacterium]|nr:MAG: hypothetical protein KatS3mg060_2212 [Dehalococcoidia bacterium]
MAALAASLPVAFAAPSFQAVAATVTIVDDAVTMPATVTVRAGERVRFINRGVIGHNVVADSGLFRLPTLAPGESAEVSFPAPGTLGFSCTLHTSQRGTVVVLDAPAAEPPAAPVAEPPVDLPGELPAEPPGEPVPEPPVDPTSELPAAPPAEPTPQPTVFPDDPIVE